MRGQQVPLRRKPGVPDELVPGAKFNEVGLKALIAVRSKKLFRSARIYFVYAVSAHQEHAIISHLRLTESCSNGLYNFLSKEDRSSYFELALRSVQRDALPLHHATAVVPVHRLPERKALTHQKARSN